MSADVQQPEKSPPNRYEAPRESVAGHLQQPVEPSRHWRTYLWIHLGIVIVTGLPSLMPEAQSPPQVLPHGIAVVLNGVLTLTVVLLPLAPFLTIYLVVAGLRKHSQYFVIAAADAAISFGHWFAAWPGIH